MPSDPTALNKSYPWTSQSIEATCSFLDSASLSQASERVLSHHHDKQWMEKWMPASVGTTRVLNGTKTALSLLVLPGPEEHSGWLEDWLCVSHFLSLLRHLFDKLLPPKVSWACLQFLQPDRMEGTLPFSVPPRYVRGPISLLSSQQPVFLLFFPCSCQ